MQHEIRTVKVLDLLLYRENPRHTSKRNQREVIDYLVSDEEVYNLARHMSQRGTNPLEFVAVFPDDEGNLIVAEGNRRVCAAQLLTDPERAPESVRSRFKALAAGSRDVSEVGVVEFNDYETAQPWLQVLHDGEQDGIGRRRWKPEQKARATTNKSTDALAVALIDYAIQHGIVSAADRPEIQVSTATRYLANPAVRKAMGIASTATSNVIEIVSDEARLAKVLADFFDGIRPDQRGNNTLHPRSVTKHWTAYDKHLEETLGVPDFSVSPSAVGTAAAASKPSDARKPAKVPRVKIVTPETRHIVRSPAIIAALNKLESAKLSSLYNSLTTVRLDEHPALMTTGAWVFVETLTALHGRTSQVSFVAYLSPKFSSIGLDKSRGKECRLSLEYISEHGDAEKHSATFTAHDARNLNNHFATLDTILVSLLNDCIVMKKNNP